jgi:alkylated DNA nucleotide flippase Atl1
VGVKKVDWGCIWNVINSIPRGYWMSYADVCEAAGWGRKSAQAMGLSLARAKEVPENVHRVLRSDGSLSVGWKGVIGGSDECFAKLKEEGVIFTPQGLAHQSRRYRPKTTK